MRDIDVYLTDASPEEKKFLSHNKDDPLLAESGGATSAIINYILQAGTMGTNAVSAIIGGIFNIFMAVAGAAKYIITKASIPARIIRDAPELPTWDELFPPLDPKSPIRPKNWANIDNWFGRMIRWILDQIEKFKNWKKRVQTWIDDTLELFSDGRKNIEQEAANFGRNLKNKTVAAGKKLLNGMKNAITKLFSRNTPKLIKDMASKLVKSVMDILSGIESTLWKWKLNYDTLVDLYQRNARIGKQWYDDIGKQIDFWSVGDDFKRFFPMLDDNVKVAWADAVNTYKTFRAADDIASGIVDVATKIRAASPISWIDMICTLIIAVFDTRTTSYIKAVVANTVGMIAGNMVYFKMLGSASSWTPQGLIILIVTCILAEICVEFAYDLMEAFEDTPAEANQKSLDIYAKNVATNEGFFVDFWNEFALFTYRQRNEIDPNNSRLYNVFARADDTSKIITNTASQFVAEHYSGFIRAFKMNPQFGKISFSDKISAENPTGGVGLFEIAIAPAWNSMLDFFAGKELMVDEDGNETLLAALKNDTAVANAMEKTSVSISMPDRAAPNRDGLVSEFITPMEQRPFYQIMYSDIIPEAAQLEYNVTLARDNLLLQITAQEELAAMEGTLTGLLDYRIEVAARALEAYKSQELANVIMNENSTVEMIMFAWNKAYKEMYASLNQNQQIVAKLQDYYGANGGWVATDVDSSGFTINGTRYDRTTSAGLNEFFSTMFTPEGYSTGRIGGQLVYSVDEHGNITLGGDGIDNYSSGQTGGSFSHPDQWTAQDASDLINGVTTQPSGASAGGGSSGGGGTPSTNHYGDWTDRGSTNQKGTGTTTTTAKTTTTTTSKTTTTK